MTKSASNHSADKTPVIVPNGYWTFWFVISLLGGIGGFIAALYKHDFLFGMISLVWGVAWAVVYWRVRHAK